MNATKQVNQTANSTETHVLKAQFDIGVELETLKREVATLRTQVDGLMAVTSLPASTTGSGDDFAAKTARSEATLCDGYALSERYVRPSA